MANPLKVSGMTPVQMEERLNVRFPESQVAVIDLTGTADHFEVRISSPTLKTLPRLKQHQEVMAVFSDELKSGEVHALSVRIL